MKTVGKSVLRKQNTKVNLYLPRKYREGFIVETNSSEKAIIIIPFGKTVSTDAKTYEINRKKQDIIKLDYPWISIHKPRRDSNTGTSIESEQILKEEAKWLEKFLIYHGTKLTENIYVIDKQLSRTLRMLNKLGGSGIKYYEDINPETDIKTLKKILTSIKKF